MKLVTTILTMLVFTAGLMAQDNWVIDKAHTGIRFTTTHMTISEVEGQFNEFEGKVTNAGEDFVGSEVEFTAQVSSIDTKNERRNNHLKSEDFFDAEKYPEIKFKGNIIKEEDQYYLTGDLTIKDVTNPIKFDVQYNGKISGGRGAKAGFKATGSIDRFDYALTWNRALEAGGLVVGKEVFITCNIELNEARE